MADELLDLVDSQDQVIGTVLKSLAHQNPKAIHREVAIAIFNHSSQVLLQQRSLTKSIYPGLWTISAAGHVGAGEDPLQAATRETLEELGLKVKLNFFEKFFKTRSDQESRFIWVYYAKVSHHPKLNLDSAEVTQADWINTSDLEKFSHSHDFPPNSSSYQIINQIIQTLGL